MRNTLLTKWPALTRAFARTCSRWTWLVPVLTLLGMSTARAQVNLYTFAQTTGNTYAPLPAPTVLGASTTASVAATDDAVYPVTIPFSFTFNSVAYTSLSVNTNGYVTFGATVSTATGYVPISTTRAYAGAIAALGGDLSGSAVAANLGELSYQTLGTSPNRTLVIQWKNYVRYSAGYLADVINFQIQLSEASNVVQMAYGPFTTVATPTTPQVGLRGATNTVYTNRTTATDWSATTAGLSNAATMTVNSTVKPATGLTYTFTPPVPCTAPPTAGTAVAATPNGCGTVSSILSLTGGSTGTGLTYQWQQSASVGGPYATITGATSATYSATGLTADTYFQAIVTCSGQSATSAPALVSVYSATAAPYAALPVAENFESWASRCGNLEVPGTNWRATPTTGNNSWRRNDQGFSTAAWSFINDEPAPYPTTSSQGSYSARFHSYGATTGTGTMDLFVNLSAAGTKTLTFDYINPTGTDKLDVLLSTDGGTTFSPTPLLTVVASSAFGGQSVTFTATSATSVLRFRATTDYGADDIGIDNLRLNVTPACPGVAFSPTTAITSTSATVNFTAAPGATSYTVNYSPGGTAQTVTSAGAVPLSGLLPYTLYTVTVTTNCGGQSGTATTSFRTAIGNNECSGAVALTPGAPGAACSAQTYTTAGATASVVTSACTAVADGDVWFSFVAGGTRHSITVTPTFDFDAVIELRSGACPGTGVTCQNASTSGGGAGTETLIAAGLTPGTTYLVRVYSAIAGASSGNFDICITTPANLPCAQVTNEAVTNTGSTSTASTAQLTFTAAAGAADYFLTLVPTAGGTSSSATLTGSPVNLTGLTPGTSYTITVSTNCSNGGVSNPVTIIFTSAAAPTPPANDDCANAVVLTSATTCAATSGTVAGATQSLAPIVCNGFTAAAPAQDVWYQFTATGTTHTIAVTGTFDGVLEVLSGACGATANVGCADVTGNDETLTLTTLTAGAVYRIRYYPYVANPTTATFTICVTQPAACAPPTAVAAGSLTQTSASISFTAGNGNTSYTVTATPATGPAITATGASPVVLTGLTTGTQYSVTVTGNCSGGQTATSTPAVAFTTVGPPPANDDCANATLIACGQTLNGTTVDATTTGEPTAACGSSSNTPSPSPSVFYRFVGTGDIVTATTCGAGTTIDTELFVYSGSCGALTCVDSNDDFSGCSANTTASQVTFTSVVGTTYYLMVQRYSLSAPGATGAFSLTLDCVAPPACAPATNLAVANVTTTTASLTFTAGNGNTSYAVTYTPAGGAATTVTPAPTASPVALTGLTPGTAYAVSVLPLCAGGGTTAAITTSFTTAYPVPANDQPAGAILIGCNASVTGTTLGATTTNDPAVACGVSSSTSPGVFYRFVGTGDLVELNTCTGSNFDTQLQVFTSAFVCVAGNDDNCGNFSRVSFQSQAGVTYFVFVNGFGSNVGDFGLTSVCTPNLTVSTPQNVSGTYNNVTVQSGGVATLTGTLTVNGILTVQSGGTLAQNCQTLTGPGSFVLQAGGALQICDAAGITPTGATGAVQVTGTRTYASDASYTYNGTAAQVTGSGLPGTVRNLTVNNATGLTLSQGVSIAQVARLQSGNLATGGQSFTLLSSAAGTALVDNTGGVVTGTGTMQRAVTNTITGPAYRHFSSPVQGTTLADLTTTGFAPTFNPSYNGSATPGLVTPFPTVFGYDQARIATVTSTYGAFDKGWFSPAGTGDVMQPTRGYTVNAPATATPIDFVGSFNNAAQNSGTLSRGTDAQAGWQLLGNPYPSPLDWSTVAAGQRPGMDGAMYVYQSTGQYAGTYRSYDNGVGGSPLIDAGSGYFARVTNPSGTGSVNLTNANRVTTFGPEPAFGRGTDTRPQLHLLLSGAGITDEAFLYLQAGATASVEAEFDALKLANPAGLDLASLSGTEALAINGLAPLTRTDVVVPLLVRTPQVGTFSFEVAALNNFGATTVYLRDAFTGTQQQLAAGTRYSFALASATAGSGRFSVVFRPANVTATRIELNAASVSLYPNPAHRSFTVLLPPLAGQREVRATLMNALGQEVLTRTIGLTPAGASAEFNTLPLATGVYTLRLQAENQALTKRVVIE